MGKPVACPPSVSRPMPKQYNKIRRSEKWPFLQELVRVVVVIPTRISDQGPFGKNVESYCIVSGTFAAY